MTAKLHPFWRLIPPYHPKACWYNACENCIDWIFTPPCSIDTVDFKEGVGSIVFPNDALINIPSYDPVCVIGGFWVKIPYFAYASFMDLEFTTVGGYSRLHMENELTNGRELRAQMSYKTPVDWYTFLKLSFPVDVWVFMEMLVQYNPATDKTSFITKRNGVYWGGSTDLNGNAGAFQLFKKVCTYGSSRTMTFDYVRVASVFEYPPA